MIDNSGAYTFELTARFDYMDLAEPATAEVVAVELPSQWSNPYIGLTGKILRVSVVPQVIFYQWLLDFGEYPELVPFRYNKLITTELKFSVPWTKLWLEANRLWEQKHGEKQLG